MKKIETLELIDLTVEPNQILNIPPRFYQYNTINIKEGGVLKINDNGSKWLILQANEIIFDGSIEYINFRRGIGSVVFTLPTGENIDCIFNEGLGGSGGNGSGNGRLQGGMGYKSNDYNGGGGGSGAYYLGHPPTNFSGIEATDFRGAPSPGASSYCFGGNGARQPFGHGGLICIIAGKITFGSSSKIKLQGSDGTDGTSAGGGSCYGGGSIRYWGGGGGGGGSAGGNGGVLIVKCNDIVNMPTVDLNPGKGGKGGSGGRSSGCSYYGSNGMDGDDGEQGYADWQ